MCPPTLLPSVRSRLKSLKVPLESIKPSGPKGHILKGDVLFLKPTWITLRTWLGHQQAKKILEVAELKPVEVSYKRSLHNNSSNLVINKYSFLGIPNTGDARYSTIALVYGDLNSEKAKSLLQLYKE